MLDDPDAETDAGDEVDDDGDQGHDDERPEQLGLLLPRAVDHDDDGQDLEDVHDEADDAPEAVAGGEAVLQDVEHHEDEGRHADDEGARLEAAPAAAGAEELHLGGIGVVSSATGGVRGEDRSDAGCMIECYVLA